MRYVPLFLALSACGGAAASTSPTAPTTRTIIVERVVVDAGIPRGSSAVFAVGDEVQVQYGSTWYPAKVQSVLPDGRVEIAYDGYGREWNEPVGPSRIRPRGADTAPGRGPPPGAGLLAKGAAIYVEWNGQWYPGTVRAVTPDQRVEIAYDGYGDQWNEVVSLARLRLPD